LNNGRDKRSRLPFAACAVWDTQLGKHIHIDHIIAA
jgi:hypothetical protein